VLASDLGGEEDRLGPLRVCLQSCFQTDYAYSHSGIAGDVGCSTNACLCRADTLGLAVEEIGPKP
jgi:hypothetical protein